MICTYSLGSCCLFSFFSVDPAVFKKRSCKKISIVYEEYSYTICLSNKKIYVIKRQNAASAIGEVGITDARTVLA